MQHKTIVYISRKLKRTSRSTRQAAT